MSIPKPQNYTYCERLKSAFQGVHDPSIKRLCDDLINFVEKCSNEEKLQILDFTHGKTEERIGQFQMDNRDFFNRIIDNLNELSSKKISDQLFADHLLKSTNKSRVLLKSIEKHAYQVICLCALYSPLELQQSYIAKLISSLRKHQHGTPFGSFELTSWTALLLLINPVKLKQQCDGSVEIFVCFNKMLNQQQNALKWANACLQGTIQLALGVAIKYARNSLGLGIPHEISERDLVDEGIKKMALEFLQVFVIQMPYFHEFSFSVDLIDSILKNLICYFPEKLIEMYNLCEEELYSLLEHKPTNAGNMSLSQEPQKMKSPNFDNLHFKTLLELITALYEPENPQLVQLSLEFSDPNCEGLCDFIYRGKSISAPALKVAYLSMLKSLCKNAQSAEIFFNLFK